MFENKMITTAIPERVYELCLMVRDREMLEAEMRKILEPAELGGASKYFGSVRNAAIQLGLISIKEDKISLAVDKSVIDSFDSMRKYIISNSAIIKDSLFYKVTKAYVMLNEKIYSYDSVTNAELVAYLSKQVDGKLTEEDMRAWRFWATFLGFGHLHDMLLIPNLCNYIKCVLEFDHIEKNKTYTFEEFMTLIRPYCEMVLGDLTTEKNINMAFSNGLRVLHDDEKIQLSHKLDAGDMWFLYKTDLHPINSTVTHVTVRG